VAVDVDWSKVKGKTYNQQYAYFREFFRPRIEAAVKAQVDASIAEGFELLDALLDLQVAA
jgi:S-methylmethionine-dependent homocysteine/selenocysteine methylase